MGFESIVAGYISCRTNEIVGSDWTILMNLMQSHIENLPILENDSWPFLSREIFSISKPPEKTTGAIAYESIIVHFGMSVKQLEVDLEGWLRKYESFMKSMPGAWESLVHIKLVPYTAKNQYQHLNYRWHKRSVPKTNQTFWNYEGDAGSWAELTIPKAN